MEKLQRIVIGVALLAIAGVGSAQGPGGSSGASSGASGAAKAGSQDPFVECRNELKSAKAAYDAKKISKQEYDEARKKANAKLKASGVRGDFEKNLDCQP